MVVTSPRRKYGSSSRRVRRSFRGGRRASKKSKGGKGRKGKGKGSRDGGSGSNEGHHQLSNSSNTVDASCNTFGPAATPFERRQMVDGWTNTSRPSSPPRMHGHTAEASCSTHEPPIRVYVSSLQGETEVIPADLESMLSEFEFMLAQDNSKTYQRLRVVCHAEDKPDSAPMNEEDLPVVYRTFAKVIEEHRNFAVNMFEMIEVEINNLNFITKFDKLPGVILDIIRARVMSNQVVPSFEYKFRFHHEQLYFVGTSNRFMNFESSHDMIYRSFRSTNRRTYRSITGFEPCEAKVSNEMVINRVRVPPSHREIFRDPLNPNMSIALYSYSYTASSALPPREPVDGIEPDESYIPNAMASSSLPLLSPPPQTLHPSAGTTYFSSFCPPSSSNGGSSSSGGSSSGGGSGKMVV